MHRNASQAFWQDLPMLTVPLILALLDRKALRGPLAHWKISVSLVGTVAVLAYTVYGVGLPTKPLPGSEPGKTGEILTFQPNSQFQLLVKGQPEPDTRILECSETLQFLLISDALSKPLLLDIRSSKVAELEESPEVDGAGAVTLPRHPETESVGSFSVGSEGLRFEYRGSEVALRNR